MSVFGNIMSKVFGHAKAHAGPAAPQQPASTASGGKTSGAAPASPAATGTSGTKTAAAPAAAHVQVDVEAVLKDLASKNKEKLDWRHSIVDLMKLLPAKSWPAQTAAAANPSPPHGITQCQPCHQPNFEGGPPAPRLAGLSYEYLAAAMRSFAADERTNNGDMPKFMQALTDSERDAMARYLSEL